MFLAFSSFFAYDNNHSNVSEKTSEQSKRIRIYQTMNHTGNEKVIQMGGMRMNDAGGYEVLRFIEHNQKCYISSDYVEGTTLIQWLKYHPNLTKKQLFLWIQNLTDQLECIHKYRGNPCYQYVNPYSVIVTEDLTLHFLDMSVESNEKMLVQMNRRSVRENFLPPDVNYYQAASIELDIYGLGRTIQYLLSVTDPVPELNRRETAKFQKVISRCLNGHSKRAFKKMSEIRKEIPNVTGDKSKDKKIWTKKKMVMVIAGIMLLTATVTVRGIQKKGDDKKAKIQTENLDASKNSRTLGAEKMKETEENKSGRSGTEPEREAFVKAQRAMGLLYFLELEDYEKSIQAFCDAGEDQMSENLAALVRYVAGIEADEGVNVSGGGSLSDSEEEINHIFREIEEWMPEESKLDYERCLVRGYAVEESEEHAKAILRIGRKILDEKPEEKVTRECTSYMASAAETDGDWDTALEMYTDMLGWEDETKKEDIYQKLVKLQEEKGDKDQALEICRKGAEELKNSRRLKILYMRMQCSDSDISREICAQTVREYLTQIPEIQDEAEFQKLMQEYGIVVEGENVWVGR